MQDKESDVEKLITKIFLWIFFGAVILSLVWFHEVWLLVTLLVGTMIGATLNA